MGSFEALDHSLTAMRRSNSAALLRLDLSSRRKAHYKEAEMLTPTIAGIITVLICSTTTVAMTITIHIDGKENIPNVKAIIKDNTTFISIDDVSEGLDIICKELTEGMIGICRDDICVPVRLDDENDVIRDSGELMVNAELVAGGLSSKPEWVVSGEVLRFVPEDQVVLDTVVKVGDVVPDFALPSISDGKMVSLSSFRGKRVLLFMWASW